MDQKNSIQVSGDIKISGQIQNLDKNEQNTTTHSKNWYPYLIYISPVSLVIIIILVVYKEIAISLIYWLVAIVNICVYSYYAFEIHSIDTKMFKQNKWYMYNQYWLNGLGAFVGWLALYVFIFFRLPNVDIATGIIWGDILILFVAFVGITGYLPYIALIKKLPGKN